ncbi:MAG: carbamoyl transferase [Acidobacteria bacterium]|nr:carbamoyl transferase [Acidobacteriota bacterium]
MNILSIIWEMCSTAAVMVDGQVVACVSEERFSRRKNEDSYPKRAVEYVLQESGLAPSQLDCVALAGERFDPRYALCHKASRYSVQDRIREEREFWYPRIYENKPVQYLEVFSDKVDLEQYPGKWDPVVRFLRNGKCAEAEANAFFQSFRRDVVCGHIGVDPSKIVFPHHHRSHAYYSYYGSPVRKDPVLILTADAWGDDRNASVSLAQDGAIRLLSCSNNFHLARLYRSITLLLGMKPDEHEYKVMGLAAYAKPQHFEGPLQVFRETMFVDGMRFRYRVTPPDLYQYFRDRLEGYRFDSIAGALQRYTEETLVEWVRNGLAATGARRLCFGGGIAMNVKAMMEIARLEELDQIFVCPSAGDESLAMGAAYVVMHDHCAAKGADPRETLHPLRNSYLGPDLDSSEAQRVIERLAEDGRYVIRERADPAHIARAIASGKIVGRCAGRSEFGARALGNRSILADPRNADVVRKINEKVKSRDFWMPFAPSILDERASDYLVNPKALRAPYMTIAFDTTPLAHRDLRAALHQADLTCRPQIVSRETNPPYHDLIRAFERLTGVGGILNTSFNIHGEPIIQTASDAGDVLERSDLDALVLGECWIEKKGAS